MTSFVPVGSLAAYLSVRGAAQARRDILSVQESLVATGETATAASVGLDRSEAAIAGAARASGVASVSSNKLRIAQLGVVAATERYNAVLADENASVATLARANAALLRSTDRVAAITRVNATAQKEATAETYAGAAAMRESSAASGRFSQATGGTVKQLGLLLGGFALLKGGISIEKQSIAFQKQMTLIQTQAGASAGEVRNMSKAVLDLAGPLGTSPMQLAKSMYLIESAGYRAAQAIDIETQAAKLAKIGNADLVETTDALVGVMQTGIVTGANAAGRTVAELNAIIGAGKMTMTDLNEALGTGIIASAKSFGISLQSVGAALALMTDQGTPAANAATHLRMAMSLLGAPTAKAAKYLTDIGISSADAGKQVSTMQTILQKSGVTSLQLSADLRKPNGFLVAIQDLQKHMRAAGLSAPESAALISRAFGGGKSSAPIMQMIANMDLLHMKFDQIGAGAGNFGKDWTATTHTAAFAFKQFAVEADTAALTLAQKAMPAVSGLGHVLALVLPAALSGAGAALQPFVTGWHALGDVLTPVGAALHEVGQIVGPLAPAFAGVATAVGVMWLTFKGFQVARAAAFAIADFFAMMQTRAANGVAGIRAYGTAVNATLSGNASEAQLTGRVMQAEFAAIESAALQAAAAIDRAAAVEATAFADSAAASKAATDAEVTAAEERAAAANLAAQASARAAAVSVGAAEEAAIAVDTAGEEAAIGWAAILGPIAAVGIGVALLVSMFHKSAASSKEATDAAKAYGDVLKSATSAGQMHSAIIEQLTNNDVPQKIDAVNKALGQTVFTAEQFAQAVQNGGPQLHDLQHELAASAEHFGMFSDKGSKALALLDDLNAQSKGQADALKKDLIDTKAFAGVSSSIDKVAQSTLVGSDRAKAYAEMLGIVVDKNGVAAVSAAALAGAVTTVSNAYGNASQSGSEFLTALDTFSKSAGTAADRGALIGATLKSANGDALAFAGSMSATTGAIASMTDAFAQQRDTLKQQSDAQKQAVKDVGKARRDAKDSTDQLSQAEGHLAKVRGNPKSTATEIKDALASVKSAQDQVATSADSVAAAQQAAGKAGALAYKDTERAAIQFTGTGKNMTASINTSAKGAGDLVTQLQGIQTAAMNAASAMFQHEKNTKGATVAADDAYNVYVSKTRGSLEDSATKLGLTKDQAKRLADAYFGMPKDVKTLIEQEGANPVLDVLNRIGQLLANITGQTWNIPVKLDLGPLRKQIKDNPSLGAGVNALGQVTIKGGGRYATGGLINGPGTRTSDDIPIWASKGEFMSTADATAKNYDALQAGNKGAKLTVAGQDDHHAMNGSSAKQITIAKFEQNITYPEPEPVSRLTPRALRMAQIPLASF